MEILDPVHAIRIDAEPAVAGDAVVAAIRREGVDAAVIDAAPLLRIGVQGADLAAVGRIVMRALERVGLDLACPLVPDRIGPESFVLRPPAG
jgi:hypothetical protein